MSDAVSALNGRSFDGYARVEETGLSGMITLRGDLSSVEMANAVKAATRAEMPATRKIAFGPKGAVAWMSPDELLVMVDYASAPDVATQMQSALAGQHALVANVSDARARFRVSGPNAREVIAKLAPVDMAAGSFEPGDFRRTRLAQVAGAFWMTASGEVELICFRSVAQYVFDTLALSAQEGSEVGHL